MKDRFIIKKTKYDIFMNSICFILLIGVFLYLILNWSNIPDKIPGHYNALGTVDRWGDKNEIWLCPIISVLFYIALSVLERFPGAWNTGIQVTEKNREQVYRLLKNMLVTLKVIVVADFVFISVNSALTKPMPAWFLPVFLILLFGTIVIFISKLLKLRT
ncbi:DUF1648 domain-containing protein [Anaerocolumna sedimenticola]|uniref:DUF1648 domain-containing protein n=1 Tax=Anaerocolumna sedimenticola TaxID=2696063 RepID=A0A6P1TID8_9FIRM|nr:DUF1648 domain-containing protein [Anaerocolumna sedimenticola]QHQ59811.1 DUF1648 domain-containing protein [Anaerocolumna sedimenticola]